MVKAARRALALLWGAVLISGCGAERKYVNAPPPAAPTRVSAAITTDGVDVSPNHLGAGLVSLVVTNLTRSSQQLFLQANGGADFRQQTAPINPADTAELKARLAAGSYTVGVSGRGVRSARLAVGAPQPAARDQLLLP